MYSERILEWATHQWMTDYPTVWIDIARLDAAWAQDGALYVGSGARNVPAGNPGKYEKFGRWILAGQKILMPHVKLGDQGTIAFENGRHRFAWLRDHGVTALPVTASPLETREITKRFGTEEYVSRLSVPQSPVPEGAKLT